jgi:hypothetical protein
MAFTVILGRTSSLQAAHLDDVRALARRPELAEEGFVKMSTGPVDKADIFTHNRSILSRHEDNLGVLAAGVQASNPLFFIFC